MNARQKAKYWKKRYQQLVNTPLPKVVEVNREVVPLKFKREYPAYAVCLYTDEVFDEIVKRDISDYLAEHLLEFVDYSTHYNPERGMHVLYGCLHLLKRGE